MWIRTEHTGSVRTERVVREIEVREKCIAAQRIAEYLGTFQTNHVPVQLKNQ